MKDKQRKTIGQKAKWWWNTRIVGFWRVKIGGYVSRKLNADATEVHFVKDAKEFAPPKTKGITVILTAYLRAEYLVDQIKALRNQTVPPEEIWVWSNRSEKELIDVSELADRVVISNTNWKFWGRFSLASLVRTEFVAFFDDDILPQPKWFENCLNTIENGHDGILGGSGVLLPEGGGYSSKRKVGWNGAHLDYTAEADLVGHAWFMRKSVVNFMWYDEPVSWENGEDIHLSYMALKHGGVKTFVPPHPENDQSGWSCRPDFGKIVGRTAVATYKTKDHKDLRSEIVNQHTKDGWKVISARSDTPKIDEKHFIEDNENSAQENAQGLLDSSTSKSEPKEFTKELYKFNNMLAEQSNFALVRFGDGEMLVINGEAIDISKKCNGEHKYTPDNDKDEHYRKILAESLTFQDPNYYVGLACRCCVGDDYCDQLRKQSAQYEHQLTWANIFVNANYQHFKESTVSVISSRTTNIVCHKSADISNLPFNVKTDFRIGPNAWVADYDRLLDEMTGYIASQEIKNEVFIFCAGVLSNMLIYQLAKKFPDNTYLDVGSVFDDVMDLGKTRQYLKGKKKRLNKVCIW